MTRQECPLLQLLLNIEGEVLVRTIRKEEVKLFLFTDSMVLYSFYIWKNPKGDTRKPPKLIYEFSKIAMPKTNT